MEPYDYKAEEELKRLCSRALIEDDVKRLRPILDQVRQLAYEHPDLLRSIPENTWKMMLDLRSRVLGRNLG